MERNRLIKIILFVIITYLSFGYVTVANAEVEDIKDTEFTL